MQFRFFFQINFGETKANGGTTTAYFEQIGVSIFS